MRLGLYGGTFDPIHNGHLHVITHLITESIVDYILVIPAGEPRLRSSAPHATGAQRRMMCQLAIKDLPADISVKVEVNPIEILRIGPSYTIDTVEAVKQAYPDDDDGGRTLRRAASRLRPDRRRDRRPARQVRGLTDPEDK